MSSTLTSQLLVGICATWVVQMYACELPAQNLIREASQLQQQGRIEDSERALAGIVETLTAAGAPASACLAVALNNLGSLHQDAGRFHIAERFYTRALRVEEQNGGIADTSTTLNNLGSLYLETGQYRKAQTARLRVISLRTARFGPAHPSVARAIQNLAAQLYVQGRIDRSAELYDRAIRIWLCSGSTDTSDYATAIHGKGLIAARKGDVATGIEHIESALEIWARLSHLSAAVARAKGNLAILKLKQGDTDAADSHWRTAVAYAERVTGRESAVTRQVLHGFLSFLRQTRRTSEAKAVKARIESMDKVLGKGSLRSALIDIRELEIGR